MQNMTCWLQNIFINLLTVYLLTIMPSVYFEMKKVLRDMQTLRAGCSKAEPKFFSLAAEPLPRGAVRPKFNQLEMVTTFTYKPSLVRIDARNFELSW